MASARPIWPRWKCSAQGAVTASSPSASWRGARLAAGAWAVSSSAIGAPCSGASNSASARPFRLPELRDEPEPPGVPDSRSVGRVPRFRARRPASRFTHWGVEPKRCRARLPLLCQPWTSPPRPAPIPRRLPTQSRARRVPLRLPPLPRFCGNPCRSRLLFRSRHRSFLTKKTAFPMASQGSARQACIRPLCGKGT